MRRLLPVTFVLAVACGGATVAKTSSPKSVSSADTAPPETSAEPVSSTSSEPAITKPPVETPKKKTEFTQIEPHPSPSPMPKLAIVSPTTGQMIATEKAAALEVKFRISNWDISPANRSVCLSLDSGPCLVVDDSKKIVKLSDFGKVPEGAHVLAIIARHEDGRVVRANGRDTPFAAVPFFVGKRTTPLWKPQDPMVILVSPEPNKVVKGDMMIDYYIANATLADGKYVVQAGVVGPGIGTAENSSKGWPFKISSPQTGTFTFRVALARYEGSLGESSSSTTVSYRSKTMVGPLVDVARSGYFRVE